MTSSLRTWPRVHGRIWHPIFAAPEAICASNAPRRRSSWELVDGGWCNVGGRVWLKVVLVDGGG